MIRFNSLLLSAVLLFCTACTTRIGDLTVASSENIPTSYRVMQRNVMGEECAQIILLLIPIGLVNPTIEGAIDDALDQVPGADALMNASIKKTVMSLLPIYTKTCVVVEGDAVNTHEPI